MIFRIVYPIVNGGCALTIPTLHMRVIVSTTDLQLYLNQDLENVHSCFRATYSKYD